jgi:DNA-binding NarL/FixJ family response regulator
LLRSERKRLTIFDTTMNTVRVLLIDAHEAPRLGRSVKTGRAEQFSVTRKASLSAGLDALIKPQFDLVLLSLSLPDASVAESVTKTTKMAPELPIIVLVNEGETIEAAEALRLGAQDYVMKGCHCDSLTRAVQYALEQKLLTAERDHALKQAATGGAQLTAHLSHEMRNALACIHQFGNILVDGLAGELSGEQCEYLGIMLQNASKIRSVLDSALDATPGSLQQCANKM